MKDINSMISEVNRIKLEKLSKHALKQFIYLTMRKIHYKANIQQLQSQLDFLLSLDLDIYAEDGHVNPAVHSRINIIEEDIAQIERQLEAIC